MKTKIRTKQIDFTRDAKCEFHEFENVQIEYDAQYVINWKTEDTFAHVDVFGANAEHVADSIRRLLLHKYPLVTEEELR